MVDTAPNANSADSEITPFSIFGTKMAAVLLGLVATHPAASLYFAVAAAGVGLTGETLDFVRGYCDRKSTRNNRRIETICKQVEEAAGKSPKPLDDGKIDLFLEVLRNALEDDEDAKESLYSAVLVWITTGSPRASQVRLLASGVRELSYVELFCMLKELLHYNVRPVLEEEGISEVFWQRRLSLYSLGQDGPRVVGHATPLGEVLRKHCDIEALPPPNSAASRLRP